MTNLDEWARRWSLPPEALADLAQCLSTPPPPPGPGAESNVVARVRLAASEQGWTLFRNNVGACQDQTGRHIRYGLANDSAKLNASLKSSDLVGWRPLLIDPTYIGRTVAQFTAIECKRPGWTYRGTKRELAQQKFIALVVANGGHGCFSTGEI